ncbi:hypothetical protein Sta7437_4247 [Stanieria cyanosphaera PCC 7437]|uniref:Uncharacterized protein n=1 Tax=Stanieria cyanosphaera (strain ATCC 29371 / PCC 7437) TaxID=111780 RepID=K9XYP2_STAC7|nr:hypothetical protein [Stanieria cyanosphaera]AFZ37720.1 hypothetical protein Sta7437_4247 [Stanieria cyanosphaera PCC 7437]
MKKASFNTPACRYCRYYNSEGRRGGSCQRLGVPVESNWIACSLASSPFDSPWDNLEEILLLENTFSLNCTSQLSAVETTHSENITVDIKKLLPNKN